MEIISFPVIKWFIAPDGPATTTTLLHGETPRLRNSRAREFHLAPFATPTNEADPIEYRDEIWTTFWLSSITSVYLSWRIQLTPIDANARLDPFYLFRAIRTRDSGRERWIFNWERNAFRRCMSANTWLIRTRFKLIYARFKILFNKINLTGGLFPHYKKHNRIGKRIYIKKKNNNIFPVKATKHYSPFPSQSREIYVKQNFPGHQTTYSLRTRLVISIKDNIPLKILCSKNFISSFLDLEESFGVYSSLKLRLYVLRLINDPYFLIENIPKGKEMYTCRVRGKIPWMASFVQALRSN